MIMKNQLLNLKMIALMCLMMVLGGANVWAEQYKIVFKTNTSDGNKTIDNNTKVSDVVSEGVGYISSFNSCSKAFYNCKSGVKLGNSSTKGTLNFIIASPYQNNIKKITIKSVKFGSDTGTLTLYNGTTSLKSEIAPGTDYVHTFDTPTTVSSIKLSTSAKRAYISEIILETASANTPTLEASESALDFGSVENNTSKNLTFKLSGSKLTANATLSVAGDYFTVTPTSVTQTDGTIAETDVTVSYNPTSVGSHTATLTISSTGAEAKTITLTGKSANAYTVAWNVNGKAYTDGTSTTKVFDGEKVTVLPTTPNDINGKVFVGWTSTEIYGESAPEPTDLFATVEKAPVVSANTTYYAVYANKVGSEYWKKVTADNVNSEGEGEYALLTPDGHAFNGIINKKIGQATTDAFTFVSGKAEIAPEGTCVLTLTKVGTKGYTMYNAENGYLYAIDNKAGQLAWQDAENSYWSYSSSDWLYAKNKAHLRSRDNNTFRTYNASSTGEQLVFAKKVSDIAYSGYCTTVAAAEPTYTAQTLKFIAKDGSDYYATFSNEKVTFIPYDVLCEPYTIVVSNGNIEKTVIKQVSADINGEAVKGYFIPANTGVLLYSLAETADYYTVENKTVDAFAESTNMLKPAPANGGVFEATDGYKYYKLAYGNWTNKTLLGFYWGADNGAAFYVKAGTAYLAVPAGENAAKGFTLNGEATGIEGVNANVENAKAIYNLNGQRVASMAKPGLYIVNGKKVVRK